MLSVGNIFASRNSSKGIKLSAVPQDMNKAASNINIAGKEYRLLPVSTLSTFTEAAIL